MANAHIVNFIQSLNDDEIKTAENHIRKVLSACKANSIDSKQLLLFRYITSNKETNISGSSLIKITGTKNISSLKLRLYETITESLILNRNTNSHSFSERDQVFFKLKKKSLLLRVLFRSMNQKRVEALHRLIHEITKEAKQYELYEILLEVLMVKRDIIGIRSTIKKFDEINREIAFYDYCLRSALYAGECYQRLIMHTHHSPKHFFQKKLDTFFRVAIQKMQNDYRKTKSQNIAHYLNIFQFALFEHKKDYLKAHEYCKKQINVLKHKAVYRRERVGIVWDNLSFYKTHLGNYKAAAIDSKKAQKYFIKGSREYIISKEQEMHTYLYGGNEKEALKCTQELIKHSLLDTGKFLMSKYMYYHSTALFLSGQFKEALDLLRKPLEIEKDKTRWNISLRIFKIMLYVELNKVDEAEIALESLRKHIERQGKTEEVKPRDILIVKLLREIEKTNFTYSPKNTAAKKMLKELSEKNKPTSWEHYTSELIPFHKWLERRKIDTMVSFKSR